MNVFISWSGSQSHRIALALREWLPKIFPTIAPFVSSEDIRKGSRWVLEMSQRLELSSFGILCVVPGNANAPWLNFEAGALAKFVERARVVPVLFGISKSSLDNHPLAQFQYAEFSREEMYKVLASINDLLDMHRLDDQSLQKAFARFWPLLTEIINAIPKDQDTYEAPDSASPAGQELDETDRRILGLWAKYSASQLIGAGAVAGILKISEQRTQYYLDELVRKKYLQLVNDKVSGWMYRIAHKGREFLVRASLA